MKGIKYTFLYLHYLYFIIIRVLE